MGTNLIVSDVVGNRFHGYAHQIAPNGRWLATALADHSIELWSLEQLNASNRLTAHIKDVKTVAWSMDSRLLASGGEDQVICIWDTQSGKLLRRLRGHTREIEAVAFSPDGRVLFSGGGTGS